MHTPRRSFRPFSWISGLFGKLFCRRSIIVIADHKTQHVPFAVGTQLLMLFVFTGLVTWVSYSTGSYMAAKRVLIEKDKKIASATQENSRIEAEFKLLKRDLITLAKQGEQEEMASDAKLIVEQYTDTNTSDLAANDLSSGTTNTAQRDESGYDAVFARIEFLEGRMNDLQSTHDNMVREIRDATNGKIAEIERVITMTNQNLSKLKRKQEAANSKKQNGRGFWPQGGPYEPVSTPTLRAVDPDLNADLHHLMTLHDIIGHMPLSRPIGEDSRRTSGFGTRRDPFTGKPAFHSGLDFAGPLNSTVYAGGEGKVAFAGRKYAYGNVVDIDHGLGYTTRYAHLRSVLVKTGDVISQGTPIGVQGSTGRSTGHHLHYEVRYEGRPINPKPFIKAGNYVRSLQQEQ